MMNTAPEVCRKLFMFLASSSDLDRSTLEDESVPPLSSDVVCFTPPGLPIFLSAHENRRGKKNLPTTEKPFFVFLVRARSTRCVRISAVIWTDGTPVETFRRRTSRCTLVLIGGQVAETI